MTRINWFSPLLPQRTEIAHLTCRIAQALMDRFDVIFWSNVEDASQFLPAGAKVERVIKSNQRGRKHQHSLLRGINIYHLGNDARYHTEIAEIAQSIPGIVVLHNSRLHHFEFERARGDASPFSTYVSAAEGLYGPMGLDTAQAIVSGQARIDDFVEAMPFIEPYLERSLGVLCHSATACAEIQALSDTPVLTLDLPFVSLFDRPSVRRPFEPPWRWSHLAT